MSEIKATPDAMVSSTGLPPEGEARAAPMGAHAARGAFWTLMQTFGSKATGIVSQLVLGKLVSDESFGRAATALTIVSFVSIWPRFFLPEVLVRRQRQFARLANPAFWLSFTLACCSASIIATASPLAGRFYKDPEIAHLMLLSVILWPIDAMATCPFARLQIDLRFRTINLVGVVVNVSMSVLTVLFALRGMGAYAIVLPQIITSILRVPVYWMLSPVRVKWHPEIGRWRRLFADGAALSAGSYFQVVGYFGDNLSLSIFHPRSVVGVYYFAYNLSTQALQLLGTNLGQMLLSVLAKLQKEKARQADAFLRAARSLNLVLVFFCMLQASMATPLLRALWGHKWDSAAPALQILCVAMSFAGITSGATALIQAQGRFRFLLKYQAIQAVAFMACMIAGALLGGTVSVAIAVCLFYMVSHPLWVYMALRPARIPLRQVAGIYLVPVAWSAIACAIPWLILRASEYVMPAFPPIATSINLPGRMIDLLKCAAIGGISLPLYLVVMRKLWRADFDALYSHIRPILSRLGIR